MKPEVGLVVIALIALFGGLVPDLAEAAPDPTLERLRRLGRGEWSRTRTTLRRVPFAQEIRNAALVHGLSPTLLAALVRVESAFDPRAVSHKGAQGLGQLMPSTALDLGVANPFDPVENLDGAAHYLSLQKRRFGDVRVALAAYNAGPERAATGRWPRETRDYVRRVLHFERFYRQHGLP